MLRAKEGEAETGAGQAAVVRLAPLLDIRSERPKSGSPISATPRTGRVGTCLIRALVSVAVRLIVARCEITYTGRSSTHLPEGVRLLMLKDDGTFMIWSDGGGSKVKPLNSVG